MRLAREHRPPAEKPTYIRHTSTSGIIAPYTPNWTRLEIICGRPSCGPCAPCSAITAPPRDLAEQQPDQRPEHIAAEHHRERAATIAVTWRFAPNHSVNWLNRLPCRSLSGI